MRFLHRLIGLILFVILLGACGWIVYHSAGPENVWEDVAVMAVREQMTVCCAAAGLFLLVLLYVLTSLRRRQRDRYLTFSTEGGHVSVSLKGIAAFVTKLESQFDAVSGLKARILPSGSSIDVVLDARIREGVQIHDICQLLQQRVRDSLKESLGLADVRNVTVNVREIIASRKSGWDSPDD